MSTATAPDFHHINFVVSDLERAVANYEQLGLGPFERGQLPARGVLTASAQLGQGWLVLVQPIDEDSVPARHLADHGEGFFLLSLGVSDLDHSIEQLGQQGLRFSSPPRTGLRDWRVIDIDTEQTGGVQIQLAATTRTANATPNPATDPTESGDDSSND